MPGHFKQADLCLWSNNVRGLNVPERRSHLLCTLWAARASLAFVQETHFQGRNAPALRDTRFPTGYFANHPHAKKVGVAILIARTVPFQSHAKLADPEGRYIFVKGTIAGHPYTLACVYAPNTAQHNFLTRTLHALERFREGMLILAGDLNLALDPCLDTSLGTSSLPASYQRKALLALKNLGLADSWRVAHPLGRDYSYYSTVHNRYSRLDYIFLPIEYLSLLQSSGIHAATWLDHAPVWTKIASPLYRPRERQWRLNEQVLEELAATMEMSDALQKYFEENTTPDVEPSTSGNP
ncbi:Hypothetical predicted protein [Pelobates cultripes]|uniref:exodeoxyribonuclease III n=1 Tax=Pelobates cultripes TaxID=61616 RepID=A0AAD1QZB6_PELCU|nr:Hypothetical predicted protein [Pelobates cultripes]